jgi:hypothetical protein
MTERFAAIPRWLLLATLFYAPWAYGCTEDWAINGLINLMFYTVVLWLLGCAVSRKWPLVNLLCLACVLFILALGWFSTLNAQFRCDRDTLEFTPIASLWKAGPGTCDQILSMPIMFRITGLLGILCFVIDLSRLPLWRKRLWWTVAATGVSIVLFGLSERFSNAQRMFWDPVPDGKWQWPCFFAAYYYHANAGAYINLILPVVAGMVIIAFRKDQASWEKTVWVPALFVCIAGAFVNVSKAAMVLAALLLLTIGIWQYREWRRRHASFSQKKLLILSGLAALGLLAIVSAGWVMTAARWQLMVANDLTTNNDRLLAEGVCLRMIPDAGCWGFGPGTFSHIFPHYTGDVAEKIAGFWKYAHEDYLQTTIEWGWIGALVIGIVFFGGIVTAYRNSKKKAGLASEDRILLFTTFIALVVVALHSLVDFPLQIASLQLYVAVYLGLAWGSGQWSGKFR